LEKSLWSYQSSSKAGRNKCFGCAMPRTARAEYSVERKKWMPVKKADP